MEKTNFNIFINNLPEKWNTYYEPFVGGGALLIELYKKNLIEDAVISDINIDIYNLYISIREYPFELINLFKEIKFKNNLKDYYEIRKEFNLDKIDKIPDLKRATLLIYLNRHCYNGLYRVNRKGEFNTPFGKYKNVSLPSSENILELNKLFKKIVILNEDFEIAVSNAKKGDFVYLDLPYMPLSKTSYFVDYTDEGFDEKEQIRLHNLCKKQDKSNIKFLLSNSDNKFIRELYKDFNIITIPAKRNVNSKATNRKGINELIIKNY
ncbi:MAG: DNA adenine methylase [Caldisericia bacterium]